MPSSLKKIDHIAIIMDGNGRWAKKKFVKKNSGHKSGISAAINLCKSVARNKSTNHLTLYTFSTENWNRSPQEIRQLFELINTTYKQFKDTAIDRNIKIIHLGKKSRLPKQTINIVNDVVESTKMNTGLTLNIALNYGGRAEIVRAVNKLINANQKRVSEKNIADNLDTAGMPNVDLLIRTGGEKRISNFLLWQIAYAELFFMDTLWPDFSEKHFIEALDWYQKRQRKFGGLVDNTHA